MGTTRDEVVSAALQILDERGLDGLTMRAVAEHLGVQHNTVRWHAASKGRLLELASDEMLAHCADGPLPEAWDERVWTLGHRLRDALLAHRDGARMMTIACGPDPHSLRYAEAMVSTLAEAGFDSRTASWAHWTIFYLILGIAQEQEVARDSPVVITAEQVPADRYPALRATLCHVGPGDFEQRFEFGLGLILDSLRTRLAALTRPTSA